MVCLEDGITSCGFRKMAAHVAEKNVDTRSYYVSTNQFKRFANNVLGRFGTIGDLNDDGIDEVAQGLAGSDMVGFSSMTGYSDLTRRVIERLRQVDPNAFIIWGGIHPIIHPEDAVTASVDAVCTGEGEFAFDELYDLLNEGRDHTGVRNFWFKDPAQKNGQKITRNEFLPLMTAEQMEGLPFPQYGHASERIYEPGAGFVPVTTADYLQHFSLQYQTLWSIGCPFHCTYCGNTKFIANDNAYKKLRHPSARYIVNEVKGVRERFPFVSQICFHDDSFMAIPYRDLEQFSELWHDEVGVPFAVYGVIPNYVKQDKFEILTWAGMNRIRMGIQSGSQNILDFYKRPTPPARILEAGEVIGGFSGKYHVPAGYDLIVDNPLETRQDVVDTLELMYTIRRPFNPLVYSLKVIPNTELELAMADAGVDLDGIDSSYMTIPPRYANMLLYLLAIWKPPRWLFNRLLRGVKASAEEQRMLPRLTAVVRTTYLFKRGLYHLRFMDFSVLPGRPAYWMSRLGVVRFCQRRFTPHLPRPERRAKKRSEVGARIPLIDVSN
ncbi:MAG: anaerobic magnesium-protoporphyrin monomethyl ester cyclase [Actinomycetota bacterium]|nr:anaerobic magnesium-protoporphyrin monomethyl ester cyclase [Actinomycetota bacterium]